MNVIQWALNLSFSWISNKYYRDFQNDVKNADEVNKDVLMRILDMNKQSEYGKRYGFGSIKGIQRYKEKVPITNYADYEKYIEKIIQGEKNVLTSNPVEFFGLSSGTTGKQKYIPVTSKARVANSNYMNFLSKALLKHAMNNEKRTERGLFIISMAKPSVITPGGIPAGAATSEGIKAMKGILPYIWTTPIEVMDISNQQTANYLHLIFALEEENLSYIMAHFSSNIVQIFGVLEENWRQIVMDIKKGTISDALGIDPKIKASLEKKIKPNPKRALELEKEFTRGMKGIAKRAWPNMQYVACVTGGSFNIYQDRLKYYIGDVPIYSAIYAATEALVGMALKLNEANYVIIPRAAYFEFIPVSEQDSLNPITLNIDSLKVGESYEIVITNYSGLYRYRLGDVIKVVGYYYESPIIEFLYRRGQLLNVSGEKTQESAVQEALLTSVKKWGAKLIDYAVVQDVSSALGCYSFFVEVTTPKTVANSIEINRNVLEKTLSECNPRYLAGLKANRIGALKLNIVKSGTFQKLRQELLKKGSSENQIKIPRVIKDKNMLLLLEQNTEKSQSYIFRKAM